MEILRKIRGFFGVLLLPVLPLLAIPIGLAGGIFGKGHKIAPKEFASLLRRVADDTIGDEWDKFECVPLRDKRLDDIRRKAFPFCGRPGDVNGEALHRLAAEAEALPELSN